jgi:hypothetical protein
MGQDYNKHFIKEDINVANKLMIGCPSLIIMEMKIKTTWLDTVVPACGSSY